MDETDKGGNRKLGEGGSKTLVGAISFIFHHDEAYSNAKVQYGTLNIKVNTLLRVQFLY